MNLLDSLGGFGIAVVSFLIVLGPVVLIHEFGHFIALRAIGVTVLEFGLGFPPRAVKLFEQGGTLFTLNWLPIGGFVRPLGEDFVKQVGDEVIDQDRIAWEKRQDELVAKGKPRQVAKSVGEAKPWQRIIFLGAGVVFNLIGAFLILVIVAMIGQPVITSATVSVFGVAKDSPAVEAGLQAGDVIVSANGQPIKFSAELADVLKQQKTLNLSIKRGDKAMDVSLTPIGVGDAPIKSDEPGVTVLTIVPNSPAAEVFKVGDRILQVDDAKVTDTATLQAYVSKNGGKSISVSLIRDGKPMKVNVTPRANPPANQGPLGIEIGSLGYDPKFGLKLFDKDPVTEIQRLPLGDAIQDGWQQTKFFVDQTFGLPVRLIRGEISLAQARPGGPVAIAQASAFSAQQSVEKREAYPILRLAAIISIGLAFVNILPIPGLDGGRILFVLIEIIRRKPVNPEREGTVHLVGLMVLLALMLILVVNDILNPLKFQ